MYRIYACVDETLFTTIPTPWGEYTLYWKWFCDPGFPWFTLTLIFIGLTVTYVCVRESFKVEGWWSHFLAYCGLSLFFTIYAGLMLLGQCREEGCLMKGSFEVALNTYFLLAHLAVPVFLLSGVVGLGRTIRKKWKKRPA